MKAAVLRDDSDTLSIEAIEVDHVGRHEILIETAAAGLCHSDLYHLRGVFDIPRPTVLGHESAGVVLEVGAGVEMFAPGDHVITCLTASCGVCERCLSGRSYLCSGSHSVRGHGASPRLKQGADEVHQFLNVSSFAEQLLVHESAVVRIDQDMPLDLAALIGCGVTTGLGAVLNRGQVRPGQTVAVIGCGGIGLSAIQGARLSGASRIIAVDLNADKLTTASSLGATDVLDAHCDDVAAAIRDMTGGGVDQCFEAVGSPTTAAAALEALDVGGTATIIGLMPAGKTFPVQGRLLLDDRRLQGSYMGSENFRLAMPKYVEMYLDGKLLLEEMVSSRIGLDGVNDAFASMEQGRALRDLVVF
ncbi:Zn-dependent alcohol dehydrogenase [Mycolicibacterium komossense]|uniref:Zn-dependent alcohol dehydrogenase n=1 Tax=Mycolicibacterium komossense TaxID=1779 RepID=A0ABT3CIM7_9MYCO|nr:Zn-dependent alcohol dehydrogenase [Mycolicibacterium komossense]MCV7229066.1 Zn-dependent alcohol dehydrogenase [Mycolicibacterium komossense]